MRCFVHIGTEKTGTTSLQSFLHLNREKFMEDGLIFTKSTGEKNNRALPVLAYSRAYSDEYTKRINIRSLSQLNEHKKQVFERLKTEIEHLRTEHHHHSFIFSSEHIQSRLKLPGEIKQLKEVLTELGMTDIRIIIYLRRPADIATSLYSTLIRSGGTDTMPPPPDSPHWNNICNHQQTITNYGKVFGRGNIIPRIYSKSVLAQQSIIHDFFKIFNMPIAGYIIPPRSNERLSATSLTLLRHLNSKFPKFINERPNPLRKNLVSYFEDSFEGEPYVMPADLYRAYDSTFAASDEWVRQNYFPHLDRLFDREIPEKKQSMFSDTDLQVVADLIGRIWTDKQNRINSLWSKLQTETD
jgi:hypothetical protein